jgi:integrase
VALKTSRSRRVIEAPGSLLAMLRTHKLASSYSKPSHLVFTTRTGRPLDHRAVTRALVRAAKSAGLADDGLRVPTFHELRHAHASAWIGNAGDLVELAARLGHSNPAITAAIYSHDFEAQARSGERRARLDAIYGSDEPPAPEPSTATVTDIRNGR